MWGSHSDVAKHSSLVKCDVSMGEQFPMFWRHQDPSKWWEPLAHWHSIKSQRTWNFQVFSVTFRVLRVVSRGYTLLWSDTMYFIVWMHHAGITYCHKVEEYVICQQLQGMEVVCSQPQALSSIILVTIFPAQPDHLAWRWMHHQVPPTHQYLRTNLHGITAYRWLAQYISDDHRDPASWLVIVYGKCNEILNPPSYIPQITHTFNCILHLYHLGGVFHSDSDTVQWGQYRQFSHTHCSIQQHFY